MNLEVDCGKGCVSVWSHSMPWDNRLERVTWSWDVAQQLKCLASLRKAPGPSSLGMERIKEGGREDRS